MQARKILGKEYSVLPGTTGDFEQPGAIAQVSLKNLEDGQLVVFTSLAEGKAGHDSSLLFAFEYQLARSGFIRIVLIAVLCKLFQCVH